jgi:hypothetical protein
MTLGGDLTMMDRGIADIPAIDADWQLLIMEFVS